MSELFRENKYRAGLQKQLGVHTSKYLYLVGCHPLGKYSIELCEIRLR